MNILSHKDIMDMLFIEYPDIGTSAEYSVFCMEFKNGKIEGEDIEDRLIEVIHSECRKAFEAGYRTALQTIIS